MHLQVRLLPGSLRDGLLPGSAADLLQESLGTDVRAKDDLLHEVRLQARLQRGTLHSLQDGARMPYEGLQIPGLQDGA